MHSFIFFLKYYKENIMHAMFAVEHVHYALAMWCFPWSTNRHHACIISRSTCALCFSKVAIQKLASHKKSGWNKDIIYQYKNCRVPNTNKVSIPKPLLTDYTYPPYRISVCACLYDMLHCKYSFFVLFQF